MCVGGVGVGGRPRGICRCDCTVLYCCVGKMSCMHIFNKVFRVLENNKKGESNADLMG